MALAATFAGMGFGNAGVHIPHANAYPIAGRVKDFHPKDYPAEEPMVPHGMAVALTAPEAFRFTFDASPERHVRAAQLLRPSAEQTGDAEFLPTVLTALMRDIDIPNGIGAVGYDEGDVPDLVEGTMKQQRLLATAPKEDRATTSQGSSTARSSCGDRRDLLEGLRRPGVGDVDGSGLARALYSSDASLYRVVPRAVVRPRDPDEIVATLAVCRELGVPLTMRGAGTSIAGNAVGRVWSWTPAGT